MLAWMDDEAERLTRETGEAWFWSRSRARWWPVTEPGLLFEPGSQPEPGSV
jgi:phosphoribosyl-AMP cyclohydrolase